MNLNTILGILKLLLSIATTLVFYKGLHPIKFTVIIMILSLSVFLGLVYGYYINIYEKKEEKDKEPVATFNLIALLMLAMGSLMILIGATIYYIIPIIFFISSILSFIGMF